ncbi:DgyrCDS14793 [Dimorphilus gyrociliatus]|uniref:DgyrCDS14793 n=1 Tax=Dimorphilus gyrociliatus TaxID=2664684 RepID=A0A7I8WEU6_9ANNE|nr:DgyrCDS14793 [Dimorphilus gyrociliatus]
MKTLIITCRDQQCDSTLGKFNKQFQAKEKDTLESFEFNKGELTEEYKKKEMETKELENKIDKLREEIEKVRSQKGQDKKAFVQLKDNSNELLKALFEALPAVVTVLKLVCGGSQKSPQQKMSTGSTENGLN